MSGSPSLGSAKQDDLQVVVAGERDCLADVRQTVALDDQGYCPDKHRLKRSSVKVIDELVGTQREQGRDRRGENAGPDTVAASPRGQPQQHERGWKDERPLAGVEADDDADPMPVCDQAIEGSEQSIVDAHGRMFTCRRTL